MSDIDWKRAPLYLLLFVVGALTGLAGSLVSAALVPAGLLLGLLGAGALFYGGTYALGTRSGALAPGIGWVATVMLGASGRTEGDILIGGGTVASVFLLGGIALAMICATLPRLSPTGLPAARTDR
ncbi:DUF6113 family protein [Streptomyces candidus]|uniref:Integral membrane protein n=1 Tax=Streptomyces candidus TaxID=67283 RepID=A0A7X0HD39_9ACTN|nr:DUF6113 family protein [Streptomyces candidus]MBB6435296.1 hypothetical protein [Streptomyces candidus]